LALEEKELRLLSLMAINYSPTLQIIRIQYSSKRLMKLEIMGTQASGSKVEKTNRCMGRSLKKISKRVMVRDQQILMLQKGLTKQQD
jgi:hypothetical protein